MSKEELESYFPKLELARYEITSPATKEYNCIAWAAHDTEKWWWPGLHPISYWPNRDAKNTVKEFVEVFESFGYQECDNHDLEPGYEKIALYELNAEPTHMARQLPNGQWTSKCGELEDITHSLESLEGHIYGAVSLIMRRKREV